MVYEWFGRLITSPFLSVFTGLALALAWIWIRKRFAQPRGASPQWMLAFYALMTAFLVYQGFLLYPLPVIEALFTLNEFGQLHLPAAFLLFGLGLMFGELVEVRRSRVTTPPALTGTVQSKINPK